MTNVIDDGTFEDEEGAKYYIEGYSACYSGIAQWANPYGSDTDAGKQWDNGYSSAIEEMYN